MVASINYSFIIVFVFNILLLIDSSQIGNLTILMVRCNFTEQCRKYDVNSNCIDDGSDEKFCICTDGYQLDMEIRESHVTNFRCTKKLMSPSSSSIVAPENNKHDKNKEYDSDYDDYDEECDEDYNEDSTSDITVILGERCNISEQCKMYDANSNCSDNGSDEKFCKCIDGYHRCMKIIESRVSKPHCTQNQISSSTSIGHKNDDYDEDKDDDDYYDSEYDEDYDEELHDNVTNESVNQTNETNEKKKKHNYKSHERKEREKKKNVSASSTGLIIFLLAFLFVIIIIAIIVWIRSKSGRRIFNRRKKNINDNQIDIQNPEQTKPILEDHGVYKLKDSSVRHDENNDHNENTIDNQMNLETNA